MVPAGPPRGELRLPQRGADVHQDLTLQGRRGYGPVRGERFRQRAPSHAYGRQPEARRLGWREDGEVWSFRSSMTEPSGFTVIFAGPDPFKVMVFPVSRFVNETVSVPVTRKVVDPSEVWSIVTNSLSATAAAPTSNPQYVAGRVKGAAGKTCQFGPRARAGDAVISPPAMPSSAPSTAITPSRLMAITSTSRPPRVAKRLARMGGVTGQGTVVPR